MDKASKCYMPGCGLLEYNTYCRQVMKIRSVLYGRNTQADMCELVPNIKCCISDVLPCIVGLGKAIFNHWNP
jgi:hypothetical protein